MTNHYVLLHVEREATAEEIKTSYKTLALENHPDKTYTLPDKEQKCREEHFKAISGAYEILSDPSKRVAYDRTLPPLPKHREGKAEPKTEPKAKVKTEPKAKPPGYGTPHVSRSYSKPGASDSWRSPGSTRPTYKAKRTAGLKPYTHTSRIMGWDFDIHVPRKFAMFRDVQMSMPYAANNVYMINVFLPLRRREEFARKAGECFGVHVRRTPGEFSKVIIDYK